MNTCENCDGTGGWVWIETSLWDDGIRENWDECPACGGSGRVERRVTFCRHDRETKTLRGWSHYPPPQLDMDEAFEP